MAKPLAQSLEAMIDNETLHDVSVTQTDLLKKMSEMNARLERFCAESDHKLAPAQAACTSYIASMKTISQDLSNIFTRVRTLRKLLHQKYPSICPDFEEQKAPS
ncbi:putative kxDL motif-containing protein [Monocercomonoides exilis]|uniref:putative kxDL motif-containing protein n=1 Tax=Monocercomonoides exilis TaxID=2049356 RepID=UPI00355AB1B0|nr:putative kxDL motif-containing protein [Monocercomonoides exilis]|eukprot:MONOS_16823.1-p1 / transcript=MONOS_16823.1 / gene=MONOS_16823 / organism=Monocercomonoides_exilis_PA203 / gene_product=kxDL motif-containing protein / transcript_product=kxDL motif-containing protein / location=Mono_scaffold00398:20432-20848(+) / protein_length=104 / sequence_SO=supercontig / SO=protein_coding / is_pseudo=false